MTDGCLKLFRDAFENYVSVCCPLVCSVFLCLRDRAVTFYLKFEISGKGRTIQSLMICWKLAQQALVCLSGTVTNRILFFLFQKEKLNVAEKVITMPSSM